MDENHSTKDKILDAALDLFAKNGYDGTSVDMIAKATGIKAPSLYKHFKSKDEIQDALNVKVKNYYASHFESAGKQPKRPENMDQFNRMMFAKIKFTLFDETIRKGRMLMTLEQFRNPMFAELTTVRTFSGLHSRFKVVFEQLMAAGILEKGDASMMALEYISPVSLLIQVCDRQPNKEAEVLKLIKAHLKHFAEKYGKKEHNGL